MPSFFENKEPKKDFLEAKNEIEGLQEKLVSKAGLGYNSMIFRICRKNCSKQKEQFIKGVAKLLENFQKNLENEKIENPQYYVSDIILSCISFIYVYLTSSNTLLVNSGKKKN